MEEGAADKCREFIEKALQYQYDNSEALQLMASYLFSTERNQVSLCSRAHMHTTYLQLLTRYATELEGMRSYFQIHLHIFELKEMHGFTLLIKTHNEEGHLYCNISCEL